MREIKFKAYHSEYGEGSVISLSFYEKTREINSDTECYAYYPKMNESLLTSYNDVELMQYTGLKDKNGAEIYEGDIVKTGWQGNKKGVVVFDNLTYCVDIGSGYMYFNHPESYEVIGNIYEKRELLESGYVE